MEITIIKYPNRKFYVSGASRYTNLRGIYDLVQQGVEVRVLNFGDLKDITKKVLWQLIAKTMQNDTRTIAELSEELRKASEFGTYIPPKGRGFSSKKTDLYPVSTQAATKTISREL